MHSQDRIRLARRHAGMSQARLAEAIGVQRSAVSHWESPQGKNPSVDHLRQVAMVAGVAAHCATAEAFLRDGLPES